MKRNDFNRGWRYSHLGEADWKEVTLPHDAMLPEPRTAESAGGTNTGWFACRDYLYEKRFTLEPALQGQTVILEFEGVYRNAEVCLNGEKIAEHPYGYSGFWVEVGEKAKPGEENVLTVTAHNADQPNSRWYSGAGIYRPVWMWTAPKEHIKPEGVQVKTLSLNPAKVEISVDTAGSGPVQVEILDLAAAAVVASGSCTSDGRGKVELEIPEGKLWSPETPNLYTCRVTFGGDCAETNFGVRTVECDAQGGFRVNGKRIILRGCCIHHDNGILGACAFPEAEERKVRLLQQAGYNAIRSAHNPCSKALLDVADRLGMLILDEYADMWYIHKTRYDYANYVSDLWQKDLAELVARDFSHPSVVMYSIGNEVAETAQPRGIQLTEDMTKLIHQLDGTRPVTCGINIFFNFLSSMGMGVYSDEKAAKEAEKAEKSQSNGKPKKKKAVGSEFINNVAGLFGSGFMKFGATLHGSNVKTRDAFGKLDIAGYNYGEKRYEADFKRYPERVILGSETFAADAARFWDLAKTHNALIGDFVWTGIDHLGEVGLGAMEYKDYAPEFDHGPGWITSSAGVLDLIGTPTGQTAYTQVAFEMCPIRIGVIPADHAKESHSPSAWRMSNAYESWAWNGCDGKETTVEVYARGASVGLFLNGKQLGKKKLGPDCRVSFPAVWRAGKLTAVVYDKDGKELARTSLASAGAETMLKAEPEDKTVAPEKLTYIRLRYTDKDGLLKPLARGDIKVQVEGGTLVALGSACPYNERGYLEDATDTYYGQAMAVVRAGDSGTITLHAESPFGAADAVIPVSQ